MNTCIFEGRHFFSGVTCVLKSACRYSNISIGPFRLSKNLLTSKIYSRSFCTFERNFGIRCSQNHILLVRNSEVNVKSKSFDVRKNFSPGNYGVTTKRNSNVYSLSSNICHSHFVHTSSQFSNEDAQKLGSTQFNVIYKLKYIRHLQVASRAKYYFGGLTMLVLLPHVYNDILGSKPDLYLAFFGASVFATVFFILLSMCIPRLAAQIAIEKDLDLIRVSYLSFNGKRQDFDVPKDVIIPFSDIPAAANKNYKVVKLHDIPTKWYIFPKHASIYEAEQIEKTFGKS